MARWANGASRVLIHDLALRTQGVSWVGVDRAVGALHQRPQGTRICPHGDAHLRPNGACQGSPGQGPGFFKQQRKLQTCRGGLRPTAPASQPSHESGKNAVNPPGSWAHHDPIRGGASRRTGPPATFQLGLLTTERTHPKGECPEPEKNGLWSALITKKALWSGFNSRF